MKKKIWSLLLCMALLLTCLQIPMVAGADESTPNVDGIFSQEQVSTYRSEGTYPTKAGYVFAGWYTDSTRETPVTGTTPAEGAYAKFVSEDVLTVLFQVKEGTTKQSDTTDLRVITSVDSLLYTQVGFKVQVGDNVNEIKSNTVYSTIAAYVNEQQQSYKAKDVFDEEDSLYFATKVITGIKNASMSKEIVFTPFWVTMDGTKVTGTERTVKISDELKLVANPLGFQSAASHTTVTKVTFQEEDVIRAEGRKVVFQDVIDANSAKGEFFTSGYTHLQFDIYIESWQGTFMQMATSMKNVRCGSKGGALYCEDDKYTFGQYVRVYNQAGESARLNEGAWYTISMKVDDISTDVSFVSSTTASVFYLKNLKFTNAFPNEKAIVDSLGFLPGIHDREPSVLEPAKLGEEDVIMATARKVLFKDVIDASGAKGKFFNSGYTHLQFDIYLENVQGSYLQVATSGKNMKCNGQGEALYPEDSTVKVAEWVRIYNQNGAKSALKTGAWYTISVKVDPATSTDVSFVSAGTRSVFYLKNLTFTYAFPEEKPLVANPLGFIAGSAKLDVVAEVTQTTKDDEDVIRVTGRKVCFQDVIDEVNGKAKGDFFQSAYQYIAFDVYFDEWTANYGGKNMIMINTSNTTSSAEVDTNGIASDWDNPSLVFSYRDGVQASPKAGEWTTIYVKVDKTTSTDVSFCSPGTMSTFYLKNLTFTNSLPQ